MFAPTELFSAVPTITIAAILAWAGTIPPMSWAKGSATAEAGPRR